MAAGGGWWRGPPEQTQCGTEQPGRPGAARFMTLHPSFPTQRPLSGASGCIGPCLLLFVTSVYLSFLSLSCPTFPFLFFLCPSIPPPPFLYLGISFLSFTPSFFPRHPDQLFIETGCLQLSVRSWAAAPEVGRVARGAELFPNTSVSSLCNIHDLSATLTPQLHVFCKTTHTHCTEAVRRRQRCTKCAG